MGSRFALMCSHETMSTQALLGGLSFRGAPSGYSEAMGFSGAVLGQAASSRRLIGAVLPWVGVALIALSLAFAAHSWRSTRGLVAAQATVSENVETMTSKGDLVYTPRLRFYTPQGALTQVLAVRGSDEIQFPAGKVVPVLYPSGDPQGAVIATVGRVYSWAIRLAVAGVILFDVGWVVRRLRP